MNPTLRRWLVPSIASATLVIPMLLGGCDVEQELLDSLGIPRECAECLGCYDGLEIDVPEEDSDGFIRPTGDLPSELTFEGDVPEGYEPQEEDPSEGTGSGMDDDADPSGKGAGLRSGKIPDSVLRPRPDRPSAPEVPQNYSVPQHGGKTPSGKNYSK